MTSLKWLDKILWSSFSHVHLLIIFILLYSIYRITFVSVNMFIQYFHFSRQSSNSLSFFLLFSSCSLMLLHEGVIHNPHLCTKPALFLSSHRVTSSLLRMIVEWSRLTQGGQPNLVSRCQDSDKSIVTVAHLETCVWYIETTLIWIVSKFHTIVPHSTFQCFEHSIWWFLKGERTF